MESHSKYVPASYLSRGRGSAHGLPGTRSNYHWGGGRGRRKEVWKRWGQNREKRSGLRWTGSRLIYLYEPLQACVLYNGPGMEKLGAKRFALRTNICIWKHLLTFKAHGQGSSSPWFCGRLCMTQPVLTPRGWENHPTPLSLRTRSWLYRAFHPCAAFLKWDPCVSFN